MSVTTTSDVEVTGKQVAIILAVFNSTSSSYDRTVLKLASQEDLTVTDESEEADFTPASDYTTRRYATSGTIDIEMSMAVSDDLSGLTELGLVDSDGSLIKSGPERKIGFGEDEHLEWAYFNYAPDFTQVDIEADSELLNRFSNVKIQNPELDASESPPTVSVTGWVEGDVFYNYSSGA